MSPKNPIPVPVLACLFVLLPVALTTCPSKEDLQPCTCEEQEGSMTFIECGVLKSGEDVAKAARSIRGKRIFSFSIYNSSFNFIPHDAFKGVQLHQLSIEMSALKSLTDTDDAFVGLEDHLDTLKMTNSVLMNKLDWSVLSNLRKLRNLVILGHPLDTIGDEIMNIKNVEYISFNYNKITVIADHAFDKFKNIKTLSLYENKIKSLKRTMLPNPASELKSIDISYNLIEQLPDDLFTNMQNLRYLYFEENKILVLNEKTFSPVWEQFNTFNAEGNAFQCDCRMSWLLEKRIPSFVIGTCASPQELKGKDLRKLTSKDLVCTQKAMS